VALNTPKLDAAVADFKKLCGKHEELFKYGQFYVTRRTMDDLYSQIEADLKANIRFQIDPAPLQNLLKFFKSKLSTNVQKVAVPVILQMLDLIELGGDMAAIRAMFQQTKTDRANAQADFNNLWSRTELPAFPLWSPGIASLPKAQAAFAIEKDRCWQVLRAFAKMLLKKRGVGSLPVAAQIVAPQLAGAVVQDVDTRRQVLRYGSQPQLSAAVVKMKAVVDAGGYVHCGLLSGARHDTTVFPQPEHQILVFAYDAIGSQDVFLFWDPDASRSSIASASWGEGFGVLFSRPGRLSTAIDDADLAGIDVDKDSLSWGDHTREPTRHCYQVYFLQSLPLAATVRLHTKVLTAPAHTSVDQMLDKATALYAARGIELIECSREVVEPGTALDRFQLLFVSDGAVGCTAEVAELHAALRDRRREFGVEPLPPDAVIAVVADLVPAGRGSAISPPEQPGVVLSAAAAGPWTLAHEIGRLAGLERVEDEGRLMAASTQGLEAPELTDEEAQAILASPLAQA
jgi:hypothetical protein